MAVFELDPKRPFLLLEGEVAFQAADGETCSYTGPGNDAEGPAQGEGGLVHFPAVSES